MSLLCAALIDDLSDKEKFLQIYHCHRNIMYAKAMSILHNPALAEEAVQESFLSISKNISKILPAESSKTLSLVVIIVRNISINILKKEQLCRTEEIDENTADISSDVLSRVISEQGYEYLLSQISSLDDIYKDVLTLKLTMDYDSAEIAELLGVPINTVNSRVFRGKKILKKKLEGYYNE